MNNSTVIVVVIIAALALLWTDAKAAGDIGDLNVRLGNGTQAGAAAGANSTSDAAGGAGGAGGLGGSGGSGGIGQGGIGQGGAGGMGVGEGGDGGTGEGGNATNTGNAQSLHFDQQVRQSPAVFMNAPAPTAPCQASIGGFLSFIGGIGLAGSRTLEECEIREAARISHAIGQAEMAREIVCMGKYAAQTSQCKGEW